MFETKKTDASFNSLCVNSPLLASPLWECIKPLYTDEKCVAPDFFESAHRAQAFFSPTTGTYFIGFDSQYALNYFPPLSERCNQIPRSSESFFY